MDNFSLMKGEAYNLGLSDANLSKMELCDEIKNNCRIFIMWRQNREDIDKRNYIVSNDKIEKPDLNQKFLCKKELKN